MKKLVWLFVALIVGAVVFLFQKKKKPQIVKGNPMLKTSPVPPVKPVIKRPVPPFLKPKPASPFHKVIIPKGAKQFVSRLLRPGPKGLSEHPITTVLKDYVPPVSKPTPKTVVVKIEPKLPILTVLKNKAPITPMKPVIPILSFGPPRPSERASKPVGKPPVVIKPPESRPLPNPPAPKPKAPVKKPVAISFPRKVAKLVPKNPMFPKFGKRPFANRSSNTSIGSGKRSFFK